MSQSQRNFLRQLRSAGVRGIPASGIPSGCSPSLASLLTCGAVERRQVGRGVVFRVANSEAFEAFVQEQFPIGLDAVLEDATDRTSGVRLFGDAKKARRGTWEGVFVRSAKPGTTLVSSLGKSLAIDQLTMVGGGAAIVLGGTRQWSFRGTIAVVENAEAFWQHERVLPEVDLAVYASGRISERVLGWLASDDMAACRVVHWGDYDPVGCLEYLRLVSRIGNRVRMHLPDSVSQLLPVHGKHALIADQVKELDALRRLHHDDTIASLVRLFDKYRRGLEQEALLI